MLLKTDIERLVAINAFIDSNLGRNLSIRTLSRHFNISSTTLRRQYYQHFELTIFRYIFNKRMEYAGQLIQQRCYTVGEVSDMVGYSEPSSFTHAFIRHHGFPPSKYYPAISIE